MDFIYVYTRQQAFDDGVLVDFTKPPFDELCKNAGLKWPVAMTAEAFATCVELNELSDAAGCDLKGRAWDVLWMLRCAIKSSRGGDEALTFKLLCWTPDQPKTWNASPVEVTLKCVAGPIGPEDPSPCLTIMMPWED
jgi:hypothetical protein